MGRPRKITPEIIAKYQTGQYSITTLSKQYNISKSSLSEYFSKNNIRVSERAEHAIKSINAGLISLTDIACEQTEHTATISNPTLVVNEVIEIIKQKNPIFANNFNVIFHKVMQESNKLLDKGITEAKDLKNITSAMKDINDTLQVIPKPPAIAQQININKDKILNEEEQKLNISVSFVGHENSNN